MTLLEDIRQLKRLMHKEEWTAAFRKLSSIERQLSNRGHTLNAVRKEPVPVRTEDDKEE